MQRYSLGVFLLISLLIVGIGLAQENTGKILGTVTDDTGAVVPGAAVTATSDTLPRGLETSTDSMGKYNFQAVPIGMYTITVSKTGFNTIRQQQIEVKIGSEVTYNAKLSVGRITETIEVSESAVSLDTTSSRTATNISQSQFDNLPKGRTFNSLLMMAPGVRTEIKAGNAGVGGIQVDGSSGSENAYFIDGVEVSDLRRGSLRAQNAVPFEMIQEVQIKSGGFEAEYGGATGGVINVATRSGSNVYHGEALFSFTNDGLNARDRGGWKLSPLNANLPDFFAPKEDNYRIFYPGFRFGGPVPKLKDKLFFSTTYMPELERSERIIGYTAGSKTFIQNEKRHYGQGRIDFTPTPKWQFATSYLWSPRKVNGNLPNRDPRVAAPTNDLSVQGGFIPAQAYTGSATFSATSRFLISARYGYRYFNDKSNNYGLAGAPYLLYETASSAAPGVPSQYAGAVGFRNVSTTFGILKDITTRHNVYLDGTYIASIAGQQHTFKLGYAMNRVANDVEDDYANGYFRIFWGEAFSRGSINNQRGAYGYYIWEDGVRHKSAVTGRNHGLYAQDAWRIHPRVTINLGLRFENEFLPPYTPEVNGIKIANPVAFGWTDKIAPRLGGAWDILGDGKWKLSGSFGIFYDVMKYELARGSFGGDYWFSNVYKLDNPNVLGLGKKTPDAGGAKIISFDNRTVPINSRGELDGIDPGIKPYSSREITFNLEHALTSRLSAAVRYTRKDLLRAIEDIGVLDAEDNEVYLIGNPGYGRTRNDPEKTFNGKTPNGTYLVPEALRQYDGVEFRLQGQWARYFLAGSYTYSRLFGNYSGSANSDESGRSDPGVSRAFDLPYYYFDASGSQKNAVGRLGTDRPHTFKFFGSYTLNSKAGATQFGLTQIAYSGTPDSTTVIYLSAPTYPNGRGDLGRTPFLTQTNLGVHHEIKLKEQASLRLEAEITNLFNQAAVIARVTQINRTGALTDAVLPLSNFFAGYKLSDYINPENRIKAGPRAGTTQSASYMPTYGLPSGNYRGRDFNGLSVGDTVSSAAAATSPNFGAYQDFRVIRLGLRFRF